MTEKARLNQQQACGLVAASLASFLVPFTSSAINIALPAIGKELGMSAVLLGWVATAYLLPAAILLVPFGKLADILGRKKLFMAGLSIFTLASLAGARAGSSAMLLAARVVQGIGGAFMFSTATAILSSLFASGRRGWALGIITSTTYIGLSVGPVIGGLLTDYLGWRAIFFVNVPLGLAALVLVVIRLEQEWVEARGEPFDLIGSLLLCASLMALILGLSSLPAYLGIWLLAGAGAGLLSFVRYEMTTAHPVLEVELFLRNRLFAFSTLAALVNYSATYAVSFLLSFYLQYIKLLTPRASGLILVFQPVVMALFSPLAGRLSDRISPRLLASAGMGLAAAGLALFAFLRDDTGTPFIVFSLIILGFGFALFSSPNTNAVMGSVEERRYGLASATLAMMRAVGQMLSMGIAVFIFTIFFGGAAITPASSPALLQAIRVAFAIFGFLCFLGVFASLARGKGNGSAQ